MRILMFTNTYSPHVGGVARSVAAFANCFRNRNHQVLIVAPEFEGAPEQETDVVRIPAIQNFNGSDFSVALYTPAELGERLESFRPQIVHAHHPFLLGNEAVRVSRVLKLPLVVTHHTLYERYTHYVPADSSVLRRFVIELATSFANLCDHVFAPSQSVANLLEDRGVESPVTVVPTGVDYAFFNQGKGAGIRKQVGISPGDFVVGHVGRLAPEKNLDFLADGVLEFLSGHPRAAFLVAGKGPSESELQQRFDAAGFSDRVILLGELGHEELRNVYAAMDVFAFASRSETQGMVLTEAMATGTPVVALDASGARDIVKDGWNGRLIEAADSATFAQGLTWVAQMKGSELEKLRKRADQTAQDYSLEQCADLALSVYSRLIEESPVRSDDEDPWSQIIEQMAAEWDIISGGARALGAAAIEELVEGELSEVELSMGLPKKQAESSEREFEDG